MAGPLILVDGSSWFYRAFHALPPLTNSKGQPTGAVYGVANMVKKLIKDYQPEHIAVIFDAKGKTFRDALYPAYKANRAPTPPDLSVQFTPLINLLKAMGLPLLIIEGVEADDVIGTLAVAATAQQKKMLISTGDKDMAQLVNEYVTLFNTMNDTTLDIEGVTTKFGVAPHQIIDYLTLVGDTIDNIPGVNKCGPKTAAKWLQEYHTLDNLMENASNIGGKIGEYLRDSLSNLPLSKQLVTIKTDVPLPVTLDELNAKAPDKDTLIALVKDLEFKNWLKELLDPIIVQTPTQTDSHPPYAIIYTETALQNQINLLEKAHTFSLELKTTHTDPLQAEIVGIALAQETDTTPVYIPLTHQDERPQLATTLVLTRLKPLLENPRIQKIGHNLKYHYQILLQQGIHLQGIYADTLLQSYVLDSNATKRDIHTLALKYLGQKTLLLEDIAGKGVKQLPFRLIPIEQAAQLATEEAVMNLQLHHTLYALMDQSLKPVFHAIEMPLLTVLGDMERQGVIIDANVLQHQGTRLKERIAILEKEATDLAGKAFNLNSPKQLQTILFEELQLPIQSKTPTGQASTAESVLQDLAFEYRLPAVILEYRMLSKLVSTYIDALPKRINPETNRVHTTYNQAVTATGRLSSSDPNLQNIPIRNEEGRLIRKAFIAPPGHWLLAADYSQIELRIMAHLSQDDSLCHAFKMGWDIHTATASEILQIPLDAVTAEQRRRAKAVNFGLIYGMSAFGLSRQLGIERQDAQFYMNRYFERYPKVLQYMEQTRALAHEKGYVETLFGRRLYLPEINTRNMARQKAAERAAINAPMQGTAADIIKKSMLALAAWQQEVADVCMIMQVHDELVFEIKKEALESCKATIKQLMENTVTLSVPLEVSIGVGNNWDEAH